MVRGQGRPGRGERARVAARVRELLGREPAADDEPVEAARWVPERDVVRSPRAPLQPRLRPGDASGWRERLRWDPGRRGVAALGLALVAVLAAVAWWVAAGRPTAMPVTAPSGAPITGDSPFVESSGGVASTVTDAPSIGSAGPTASPGGSAASAAAVPAAGGPAASSGSASGSVVVDVAGKVLRPGVYTLPAGARVYDALRSAGGARPGVSTVSLNLAAVVQDGQQIVVGAPAGAAPGVTGGAGDTGASAGTGGATAVVDLNTATLEQLDTLPGVGPVLAQHIVDWRNAHGQFTSLDQLNDVSGIGPAKFADLQGLVSL